MHTSFSLTSPLKSVDEWYTLPVFPPVSLLSQIALFLHSSIVVAPIITPPCSDPSKWRRKFPDGLALVRVTSVTPDAVQMQVNGRVQDAVQVTYSML